MLNPGGPPKSNLPLLPGPDRIVALTNDPAPYGYDEVLYNQLLFGEHQLDSEDLEAARQAAGLDPHRIATTRSAIGAALKFRPPISFGELEKLARAMAPKLVEAGVGMVACHRLPQEKSSDMIGSIGLRNPPQTPDLMQQG